MKGGDKGDAQEGETALEEGQKIINTRWLTYPTHSSIQLIDFWRDLKQLIVAYNIIIIVD